MASDHCLKILAVTNKNKRLSNERNIKNNGCNRESRNTRSYELNLLGQCREIPIL
jgi:hypothetical protein